MVPIRDKTHPLHIKIQSEAVQKVGSKNAVNIPPILQSTGTHHTLEGLFLHMKKYAATITTAQIIYPIPSLTSSFTPGIVPTKEAITMRRIMVNTPITRDSPQLGNPSKDFCTLASILLTFLMNKS